MIKMKIRESKTSHNDGKYIYIIINQQMIMIRI